MTITRPTQGRVEREVLRLRKKSTDGLLSELDRRTQLRAHGLKAVVRGGVIAEYRAPARALPSAQRKKRGREKYERHARQLPDIICKKWKYCEKRKKYKTVNDIIVNAAPLVASAIELYWGTAVIVLLVFFRTYGGKLDRLCKCR